VRESLRSATLFADLSDEDLDRLVAGAFEESAPAGTVVFAEGDEGDKACLILEGEVEILKTSGEREVLLAVRGPGEVIGEMALLDTAPRMASVRARIDTRFLSIPKQQMDDLLATSATAGRSLFAVLLSRWRETEARLRQSERMAQIGTLTAGLAHEMNNPAAAVARGAGQLGAAVDRLGAAMGALQAGGIDPSTEPIHSLFVDAAERHPPLSAMEQSDREDEMEDALSAAGVADAWKLAPELVSAGIGAATVSAATVGLESNALGLVVEAVSAAGDAASLVREVEEGADRLSAIVGALKSYSHLDRAEVQEVDLHRGLDDTLLILKRKLDGIDVRREYADGPLMVEVYASELNQVWTNLIDNAADAVAGTSDGSITLRTAESEDDIVVEIEDNGSGIPADIVDRIFDAFFTTKPPGSGTGLGLDISHGIIADRHRGELTVESIPGRTVFRAVIPRTQSG
jgi:signal transduction histidine kinase